MKKILLLNLCLIGALSLFGQTIPEGYYDGTSGLIDQELKSKLHSIISNHTVREYAEFRDTILPDLDEDPNTSDNIVLFYKNNSIPIDNFASQNQSDFWNREHTWPSSHGFGDDADTAYTDAHNLRPSDATVNTSKSNKDFEDIENSTANAQGEAPDTYTDSDFWEPRDEIKGDVARILFYMDTRYESNRLNLELVDRESISSSPELGVLYTLIQWHEADPVDQAEIDRHEGVYGYQENRNPFVDHPEWVANVFGSATNPTLIADELNFNTDFGNVELGSSLTQQYSANVYNHSEDITVTVTSPFTVSSDGTSFGASATFSDNTNGDQTITVYLKYEPTETGVTSSSAVVHSVNDETLTFDVSGTEGELTVISIAEARAKANGDVVSVSGVVIGGENNSSASRVITDGTAGIVVRSFDADNLSSGLVIGDSIKVTGGLSEFSNLLQIEESPIIIELLKSDASLPDPIIVALADVDESYESELVTIENVTFAEAGGTFAGGGGAGNFTIVDSDGGELVFRIGDDEHPLVGTGIGSDVYDVTGYVGQFGDDYQLSPRTSDDIVFVRAGSGDIGGGDDNDDVITIAEARNADLDAVVTISGVVIDAGNNSTSNRVIYDGTAGIVVRSFDSSPASADLELGDRVTITGGLGEFNGLIQISGTPITMLVTEKDAPLPLPQTVTIGEVGEDYESELVTVLGARFVEAGETFAGGGGDGNFTIVDANNDSLIFRLSSVDHPLVGTEISSDTFDITGFVGQFNDYQLSPRTASDLVKSTGTLTIAEARTRALEEVVTVTGVVIGGENNSSASRIIYDGSAGIVVRGFDEGNLSADLTLGDQVRVTGGLGEFSNLLQISESPVTITILSTGVAIPLPSVIALSAVGEAYESELVTLEGVTFADAGGTFAGGGGDGNFTITDENGVELIFRIGSDEHPLVGSAIPSGLVDITGFVGQFADDYQISPRIAEDIIASDNDDDGGDDDDDFISIAEARTAELDAVVTISGVVIDAGNNSTSNRVIYDGTAGIVVRSFDSSPASADLELGDRVTITGGLGEFNGLIQISGTPITMLVTEKDAPLPLPQTVTIGEVGEDYESELVTVLGARFVEAGETFAGGGGDGNFTIVDANNDSLIFRLSSVDHPLVGTEISSDTFDITGFVGQFNDYQLSPRTVSDLVKSTGTLTIAEARTRALEEVVTVTGVVIGGENNSSASRVIYDGSAGIVVRGFDEGNLSADLTLGDQVRVTGGLGEFSNLLQISESPVTITVLNTGVAIPLPSVIALSAVGEAYESELVTLEGVTFADAGGTFAGGGGDGNFTITDENGAELVFRIGSDEHPLVGSAIPSGLVDITGFVGQFADDYQISPRTADDIVINDIDDGGTGQPDVSTILQARGLDLGDVATITGVVIDAGNNSSTNKVIYDGTAGIVVRSFDVDNLSSDLVQGDSVMITGGLSEFNGLIQISESPISISVLQSGATLPMPQEVTFSEIDDDYESELVVVRNVTFAEARETFAGGGGDGNFTIIDANSDSLIFRLGSDSHPLVGTEIGNDIFDIIGIVGQFNDYQLSPRTADDVIFVSEDPNNPDFFTIAEARALSLGAIVQVSGVVISDSVNSADNRVIYDGTAGIVVRGLESGNESSELIVGDSVVVSGGLSEFNGTLQIEESLVLIEVLKQGLSLPEPTSVSISDISEEYESELVTISGLTFVSSGTFERGNYDLTDGENELTLRIGITDHPLVGTSIPTSTLTVVGYIGQFQDEYQIYVRDEADFGLGGSGGTVLGDLIFQPSLIYPNPVFDILTLSPDLTDIQNLTIIDQSGRVVYDKSQVGNMLDVSGLDSGLYFVIIRNNEKSFYTRMIKK